MKTRGNPTVTANPSLRTTRARQGGRGCPLHPREATIKGFLYTVRTRVAARSRAYAKDGGPMQDKASPFFRWKLVLISGVESNQQCPPVAPKRDRLSPADELAEVLSACSFHREPIPSSGARVHAQRTFSAPLARPRARRATSALDAARIARRRGWINRSTQCWDSPMTRCALPKRRIPTRSAGAYWRVPGFGQARTRRGDGAHRRATPGTTSATPSHSGNSWPRERGHATSTVPPHLIREGHHQDALGRFGVADPPHRSSHPPAPRLTTRVGASLGFPGPRTACARLHSQEPGQPGRQRLRLPRPRPRGQQDGRRFRVERNARLLRRIQHGP